MTARLRLLMAAIAIVCVQALALSSARSATLIRTAWWTNLHQGAADLSPLNPAPPAKGGLTVGATPLGATAISGLHYTLDEGETSPVLHLTVDPSSTNSTADGIVILACLAGAGWSEGGGQDLSAAPPALCDAAHGGRSVTGQRDAAGTSWIFPLASLQLGQVVDVLLVPAAASGTPVQPYQVNFAAPTARSMTTSPARTPDSEDGALAPAATTTGQSPAETPALGASTPLPGAAPPPESTAAPAVAPLLSNDQQQRTATAPILQLARPLRLPTKLDPHRIPGWVRVLAVLEIAVGALLIAHGLRSQPSPDTDPALRGVGAFVSLRSGSVPHL